MSDTAESADPLGWGRFEGPAVQAKGTTLTAREILDRANAKILELDEQPDVQTTLMDTIGHIYRSLGHVEEATLRRALRGPRVELVTSLGRV